MKDIKNFIPKEVEEQILNFWEEEDIFEKSVFKKSKGEYVFYDGPPFATGLPHYGHILASVIKDAIPRYQTMRGKRVERRWGWDCHGLPVENEVEKDLELKTKKDIESIGIKTFNETARNKVMAYASDWKKIIPRIGRWVDMENDYKTLDASFIESVLWVFKNLYGKKLIYEGNKSMQICPRCGTTLSNFEVTLNYRDITDISAYVKFELVDNPNTFLVAWTTTPWTLPGNVALAINVKEEYLKVKLLKKKSEINLNLGEEIIFLDSAEIQKDILGDELVHMAKSDNPAQVGGSGGQLYDVAIDSKGNKYGYLYIDGKDLVGKKYKPLFDYYQNVALENKENGWKIYSGDFVTTGEGTGIVHIAPAFGEDDMELARMHKLPFIQHVGLDGAIRAEAKDFAGLQAKSKEDPQATDIEVIKWLAHNDKLFGKKKIVHAYPFCWRCETPLLNYATSSWFVRVTDLKFGKNGLLEINNKINWVPEHLKKGRFGNWLEGARDWAISRSRYWGAPIPVWRCNECKKIEVVGSVEDIKKNTPKSGNNYFVMRHGGSESNKNNIVSSKVGNQHHLTATGERNVIESAGKLAKKVKKFDLIFSSDFIRTKETAEIVAKEFGYDPKKIIFDKRIREIDTGTFNGKKVHDYHAYFNSLEEKFYKACPEGEDLRQVKKRMGEFLYDIEKKYSGKNILIISHEYPIWLLFAVAGGANIEKTVELRGEKRDFVITAEFKNLKFIPLPHNDDYELDLHRPYIDEVEFNCNRAGNSKEACGGKMKRIPDVFDCWFESGSMPYGQAHYPFENKKKFEKNFPAEFIAEGLDQTRGWFYTLLVLSTGLFKKPAYKNVIVNGIILAEDGQKMSKRLKNYPDPMEIVNKYGADALRLYLLNSPVVRGENLNFAEKGVDELYKKVIMRLWNVYSFYDLYATEKEKRKTLVGKRVDSKNILDKWILARLDQLIREITQSMENYELDKATRPINDFVDDLSTWYIRRSRSRFKESGIRNRESGKNTDREEAMRTTRFVLIEFSKVVAPFMPFISETIYKLSGGKKESVHLEEWPGIDSRIKIQDLRIIEGMREVRKTVELAMAKRQEAGIKVRQPLSKLKIKNEKLKSEKELLGILAEEINVKEITFDSKLKDLMELDIVITPELKAEGQIRELVRMVQDLRKSAQYTPQDKITLYVEAEGPLKALINSNLDNLKREVGAKNIVSDGKTEKFDAEIEAKIDANKIWLGIRKA